MNFESLTLEQWITKYQEDRKHVSHLALQLIANNYKLKIYVYEVFQVDGINEVIPLGVDGILPHVAEAHVIHMSESRFTSLCLLAFFLSLESFAWYCKHQKL